MKNLSAVEELESFLNKEVAPAIEEIANLEDKSRKHVQKLLYTNIVDRFDTMVDRTILLNCREKEFVDIALKGAERTVTEAELIELLMRGETLQDALTERLQNGLRNTILRERHSRKLEKLLMTCADGEPSDWKRPRVNVNTGDIVENFKPQNKKRPHSILGYSDWLYSRRNAIVHGGGGASYLENDLRQMKKLWKCELPKTFKISLSSVRVARTFYIGVVDILKNAGT